jgi:lambda family phage portal protein
MIASMLDSVISAFSPKWGLQRKQARRLERAYSGAEANRLTNHKKPKNLSADQEMLGPYGADALRAWARSLVRDNAYAWGVVDTIVSSVIGTGIVSQSMLETPEGDDVDTVNELRDRVFADWCEVCDINGELTFAEIQALCQREIVESGEVLVRFIKTPSKEYKGISRPVPLAIELIEADRLAGDRDNYITKATADSGNRIIRGVEMDDKGKPVAYWVYPDHPNAPYAIRRKPERIPAAQIRHLFRKDRIGQSRGVTWFAPVMSWLRDLGVYVDNEIQASAVASCFGVAIKTETPIPSLLGGSDDEASDENGNQFEYLEPAMVVRLRPGESVESINPGRPNSASEPWIGLMLRGISVGTGLSYEIVARDYSKTTYSASRTSQLEDRRRFRRWQAYMINNLCLPVWDEFCNAAAASGLDGFPSATELLESRRQVAAIEFQPPTWEWVDPSVEQQAANDAINANMSTLSYEVGQRSGNWRTNLYQRAKEETLRKKLGLLTPEEITAQMMAAQTAQNTTPQAEPTQAGTGEWMGLSRLQWNRNRKALNDLLTGLEDKTISEASARAQLAMIGLSEANINALIQDASDGTVETSLPTEGVANG